MMTARDGLSDAALGLLVVLAIPVGIIVIGLPVVLVARIIIELAGRL